MFIRGERTVDVSSAEGRSLMRTYSITAVPTVILSKDAVAYDALMRAWASVGTVEKDGSLVFRDLSVMGKYRKIGGPESQTS